MKNADNQGQVARPVRAEFYRTVVIGNNGTIVSEDVYGKVASSNDPKTFRKQLKANGMTLARIFNADEYKKAQGEHRDSLKQQAKNDRDSLITEAFNELGVDANPRVKSALRTLLPLYADPQSNKKAITAFKNIIKTVSSTSAAFAKQEEAVH